MENKDYQLGILADPNLFHDPINISVFPENYYVDALERMKLIRKAEEIL